MFDKKDKHDDNDSGKHVCDACGRCFSDKYVLGRHRDRYCKVLKERAMHDGGGDGDSHHISVSPSFQQFAQLYTAMQQFNPRPDGEGTVDTSDEGFKDDHRDDDSKDKDHGRPDSRLDREPITLLEKFRVRRPSPGEPYRPMLPLGTIKENEIMYPGNTSDNSQTVISRSPPRTTIIATNMGQESQMQITPKILQEMLRHNNDLLTERIDEKIEATVGEKIGGLVPYTGGKGPSTKDKKQDGKGEEDDKEPKIDIVCLAKGDYVKKIIEIYDGDEEKAMNYIKNVGIATDFLEGDFRMIKKIYFDGKKKSQFPIRVKDLSRNKLEYLEENGEWILDIRGEIVGKRLCDNIVSTLLIANTRFNEVIINEPDEDKKAVLLDLFQINKTQKHIMKLLERKTQGKLSHRVAEFINYCAEVHAETGSLDNVKKAYE